MDSTQPHDNLSPEDVMRIVIEGVRTMHAAHNPDRVLKELRKHLGDAAKKLSVKPTAIRCLFDEIETSKKEEQKMEKLNLLLKKINENPTQELGASSMFCRTENNRVRVGEWSIHLPETEFEGIVNAFVMLSFVRAHNYEKNGYVSMSCHGDTNRRVIDILCRQDVEIEKKLKKNIVVLIETTINRLKRG